MALYIVVSLTVHQELETFNESLKELGEDKNREEVSDQLLERYVKHVEVCF
jgi:ABC-type Fe3+-hydroxamate transport system substrate-binding protein